MVIIVDVVVAVGNFMVRYQYLNFNLIYLSLSEDLSTQVIVVATVAVYIMQSSLDWIGVRGQRENWEIFYGVWNLGFGSVGGLLLLYSLQTDISIQQVRELIVWKI